MSLLSFAHPRFSCSLAASVPAFVAAIAMAAGSLAQAQSPPVAPPVAQPATAPAAKAGERNAEKSIAKQMPGTLTPVPARNVRITDEFWAPKQKINAEATLNANIKQCADTGRIDNFNRASGKLQGKYEGYFFNDSDVYKMIEGAAFAMMTSDDPAFRAKVDAKLDELIATIAAAQQPDGYLNAYYTLQEPTKHWSNLKDMHELYCAGHLFEAAVAHHQATGKTTLLDVATRFADLLDKTFGEGKTRNVCGHPEIELALVKLWKETGEERYLKLSKFFIDERGVANGRDLFGEYAQDHKPLREQTAVVGHAVRAMYLYSGATDIAMATSDRSLVAPLQSLWGDLVFKNMYVTGGIGSSGGNEGFTIPYDLPNDQAYAETCATIGLVLWNHRMNLMFADARFVDVMERGLYNGVISGVSLKGDSFFYVNPLASRGKHHRQPWFGCACCPPNVLRLVGQLGGMIYATGSDSSNNAALLVNLYVGSTASLKLADIPVKITQETKYPWEGDAEFKIDPEKPVTFELRLRLPGWSRGESINVNGQPAQYRVQRGYAVIKREWKAGDKVMFQMPLQVERIQANPEVKMNRGRLALQRGPLVYCLEGADNGPNVRSMAVTRASPIESEFVPELLGGVTVLKGTAEVRDDSAWIGELYRTADSALAVPFTAIPYYAWDNREPGPMIVWIPEHRGFAERMPDPEITATASFCPGHATPMALYDGEEPENSLGRGQTHFVWWPHNGTKEWVQYDFKTPRKISGVEVYWFSDKEHGGGCALPASWKLLWNAGTEWREVSNPSGYAIDKDKYNRTTFTPVRTTGLRIEVQLQEGISGGILEWRLME